jgi:adenylate cyclase
MFADVVDVTPLTRRTEPARVGSLLDAAFSAFDEVEALHGVQKIKTIGDACMAAARLPEPRPDHAEAIAEMALHMLGAIRRLSEPPAFDLAIRAGI